MGNPNIFPKIFPSSIMHILFLIIFCSSLLIMLKEKYLYRKLIPSFVIFVGLTIPSVLFSKYLDVSMIKYISFLFGLFSLIYISNKIKHSQKYNQYLVYKPFRNINRISLALSTIIYILGLGYTVNETGFAGTLNHPQAYGIFLVLIVLVELYGLKSRIGKNYWSYLSIILALGFSIMTESRLSIFTIVAILLSYTFIFIKPKKTHAIGLLLAITCVIFLFEDIYKKALYIISKSGRQQGASALESLESSRGLLVNASLNNFMEHPLFGIGFQISNGKYGSYIMEVIRDPIFNLPLQAPVEKGVFWTALLEETGAIGFIGLIIFLLSIYNIFKDKFCIISLITIFLIGCGESFYFSLGGVGSTVWITIFLMYVLYNENLKNENNTKTL